MRKSHLVDENVLAWDRIKKWNKRPRCFCGMYRKFTKRIRNRREQRLLNAHRNQKPGQLPLSALWSWPRLYWGPIYIALTCTVFAVPVELERF